MPQYRVSHPLPDSLGQQRRAICPCRGHSHVLPAVGNRNQTSISNGNMLEELFTTKERPKSRLMVYPMWRIPIPSSIDKIAHKPHERMI